MKSTRHLIGAAAILTLAGAATVPVLAASGRATTLHVEVREKDSDSPKMRAEMPLSVAGAMAAAIDEDALGKAHHIEALSDHGFDLRKFWEQVKNADIREFFTLESEDADIRGWRENGLLRVSVKTKGNHGDHVDEGDDDHRRQSRHRHHDADDDDDDEDVDEEFDGPQTIELRIPETLMEMLFDDSGRLTPESFVSSLEKIGPMTLVEISGGDGESVRVWID